MSTNKIEGRRREEEKLLLLKQCSHKLIKNIPISAVIRMCSYLPDFPVVTVLGFFLELFPSFHHLVIRKGYPIDSLHCFHFRIALPIRRGTLNIEHDFDKHIQRLVTGKTALKYVPSFPPYHQQS